MDGTSLFSAFVPRDFWQDERTRTNLNGNRHHSSCSSRISGFGSDMRGSGHETRRLETNTDGEGREGIDPLVFPVAPLIPPGAPVTTLPVDVPERNMLSAILSRLTDDVMFLCMRTQLEG